MREKTEILKQEQRELTEQLRRMDRVNPNSKFSKNRAKAKVAKKARKKNRK